MLLYNVGLSQSRSSASPATVVLRPSFRLVRPFYTLSFILLAIVYGVNNNRPDPMEWLMIFPPVVFLIAVWRHVSQRFSVLTIGGGKLRYDNGMLTRTTRTMDLAKVQDVQVEQSAFQRLFNIGRISIETAGEKGNMTMDNIDRPQAVAEYILEASGK